ncbi:hypothetical protein BT96DRAFT_1019069 [Gymnopus androsaceus JB14]|uniref:Uncharacterized protein n=1 Tax=Gymnopus androsaceus JB14 TaxID=1447944 RepID=A0A6A4HNT1_9AGAR|nr:hypothetical protein BT96DRAFT_1019069 [Gymnopus androsaceus JB14]
MTRGHGSDKQALGVEEILRQVVGSSRNSLLVVQLERDWAVFCLSSALSLHRVQRPQQSLRETKLAKIHHVRAGTTSSTMDTILLLRQTQTLPERIPILSPLVSGSYRSFCCYYARERKEGRFGGWNCWGWIWDGTCCECVMHSDVHLDMEHDTDDLIWTYGLSFLVMTFQLVTTATNRIDTQTDVGIRIPSFQSFAFGFVDRRSSYAASPSSARPWVSNAAAALPTYVISYTGFN